MTLAPRQLGSILTGLVIGAVLIIVGAVWNPMPDCVRERWIGGAFRCIAYSEDNPLGWMPTALIILGVVVIIVGVLVAFSTWARPWPNGGTP